MAIRQKCPKCPPEGSPDWLLTYGDMTTLLLTFFVMMFTTAEIDGHQLRLILAAFSGLGMFGGGTTLQTGKLVELGNTIATLPSMERGRAFDQARRRAISDFQPEIATRKVRVTEDERGLVISLAADSFFRPASAEVDPDLARDTLIKLADFLNSEAMRGRKFRLEGHTDSIPTDPRGPFPSNWELSAARSINVLHYLGDYGVSTSQFQIMGLADTVPLATNDTEEGRAYNRRVDLIVLSEGHL